MRERRAMNFYCNEGLEEEGINTSCTPSINDVTHKNSSIQCPSQIKKLRPGEKEFNLGAGEHTNCPPSQDLFGHKILFGAIKRPFRIHMLLGIIYLSCVFGAAGSEQNVMSLQNQKVNRTENWNSIIEGFNIPSTFSKGGSSNVRTTTTVLSLSSSSTSGEALVDEDYPFENNTFSNITVPIGDTAFLKCTVKNLGERSVFWIRRRDMHIISVGKNIYTNDERFHILNPEGSDDWILQIKYIQKRDNGTYDCQVSTGKGIASYAIHVLVAVPEAFILGNGEYHIQSGSPLNLVCIVEKSPKPPEYIFWFHNARMINYDSNRNLRIQTETGSKTHSRLIIENAQVEDSGNYTCHISNADPASTLVYISQGDKMAAIQRRKSATSTSSLKLSDYFLLVQQIIPLLIALLLS